jgi:hypothetical protein
MLGLIEVVLQTIIGLAVAYGWPVKNRETEPPVTCSFERSRQSTPSLHTIVQAVLNHHDAVAARRGDIEICGELHDVSAVPQNKLETILSDVLHIAISNPATQRVRIHTGHRPGLDQICVVAQCSDPVALPRLRILGRSDSERALRAKAWPANCSATFFDNGFEHIYEISIQKPF